MNGRGARVRVVILDNHRIVLEGLRLLLERQPDIRVIGEARSLDDALALEIDADPDVVVADLALGAAQAAEVVTALRARFPAAAVLALTMVDDPAVVRAVLSAGARGYLPKAAAGADLFDAVRRLARDEVYVDHSVAVALVRAAARGGDGAVQLSERERAVGRLLALGHTNAEVAALLIISVRTVETHRAHLFRKLGVQTRAELVRAAVRIGLVDLSAPLEPAS
ncbi:MAG TPA: response regulator transcription factor [Acidimicrobiales bacterium]|nr:response regulator transcription factor [Acidimicrobiales bacterium]HWI03488.1 response regulator transcription factor [Acidimicrobiales bacterium]